MLLYLTNNGANLLASLGVGDNLVLSKIEVGSGTIPSGANPKTYTGLITLVAQGQYGVTYRNNSAVTITGQYRNDMNGGLQTAFDLKEIGYYAKDANNNDVLVWYANLESDIDHINAYSGSGAETHNYKINVSISITNGIAQLATAAWITGDDAEEIFVQEYGATVPIIGVNPPTAQTSAKLGQLFLDTEHDRGHLYLCIDATVGACVWTSILTGYHKTSTYKNYFYTSSQSNVSLPTGDATIIAIGGGGGGGSGYVRNYSTGTSAEGGGGGGSGYVVTATRNTKGNDVYTVVVGSGGAQSATQANGNNGGATALSSNNSSFVTVTANGGGGGKTGGYTGNRSGGAGRNAGASGELINTPEFGDEAQGGSGGAGYVLSGTAYGAGGRGGNGYYGGIYLGDKGAAGSAGAMSINVYTYALEEDYL